MSRCSLASLLGAAALVSATRAGAAAPFTEALTFSDDTVGTGFSFKSQKIHLPEGKGPFPAVLILTKCWVSGAGATYERDWGRRLASWGYVALIVDSLGPRNVDSVCTDHGSNAAGERLPYQLRLKDLFNALAYLRSRPDVDRLRVGALGGDAGGALAVRVARASTLSNVEVEPLQAVVATSSANCASGTGDKLSAHLLMLIGEYDEFVNRDGACLRLPTEIDAAGHAIELKVYPGAYHAFDMYVPLRTTIHGYTTGRNDEAADDSVGRVRAFLATHLDGATRDR